MPNLQMNREQRGKSNGESIRSNTGQRARDAMGGDPNRIITGSVHEKKGERMIRRHERTHPAIPHPVTPKSDN